MNALEIIRARLEEANRKAERSKAAEKSKPSTMKYYPLRNQDQNRLVQMMHRESFSASDIYTTKLHRGILIDWLSKHVFDGIINLPVSGLMAVVTAALWNSRAHFASLASPPPGCDVVVSGLSLSDFSFLVDGLEVLDTLNPEVTQSHATCLQTVIGDSGVVAVYHKLLDGSVRQIAKGRVSSIALEVPALSQFGAEDCIAVDLSPYTALRHCYDVPPPLMERAYQHAIKKFASTPSSATSFATIALVRNLWLNHALLTPLWESERCHIHAHLQGDGCTVAFAITIAEHHQPLVPPSSFATVFSYGELVLSVTANMASAVDLPSSGMWELYSTWKDCHRTVPDDHRIAEEDVVPGTVLLMGASDQRAILVELIAKQVPSLAQRMRSEDIPIELFGCKAHASDGVESTSTFDTIVLLLPNDVLHIGAPSLRAVLALLRSLCGRCSRLLVVRTSQTTEATNSDGPAPTSGALAEMFAGALLTAQLEYFKCTMTMCYVTLCASSRVAGVQSAGKATAILLELLSDHATDTMGQDQEVHYQQSDGNNNSPVRMVRKVRRYRQLSFVCSSSASDTATMLQDGVYVITGGLGGLGLLTAQCLVRCGARKVVLLSRSGEVAYRGQGLEEMMQALRDTPHVDLTILRCDVSVESEVITMLADVHKLGPIVGIIHAAGVLSDGLIVTGKAEAGAQAVWNAKAASCRLLHKHTQQDHRLNMFIAFSSVTAAVGTTGQAAYAASNRYLESLMHDRRRAGLYGLCVRWPEVSGIGMAAALHGASDGAADRSCAISAAQVACFLIRLFAGHPTDTDTAVITLMPPALVELYRPSRMGSQLRAVPSIGAVPADASAHRDIFSAMVARSQAPAPSVRAFTSTQIRTSVHRILSTLLDCTDSDGIADDALLMQLGLDSLGATELASQLSSEFCLKVPSTLIFSYPSSKEIVDYIQSALSAQVTPTVPGCSSPTPLFATSVGAPQADSAAPSNFVVLDDVAIIGTSLSFPGNCNSLRRLWEILLNKESTNVTTPADRWDVDALLASNNIKDPSCRDRLKSAHFLTHDEPFNCQQFNMTAKEAAVMHPSHRLLLINCLRALQDASYAGDKLCTNTGVYVGIGGVVSGTGSAATPPGPSDVKPPSMSAYSATSHSISVSAGRISFSLGLSGPCMAIDTACSSSLVALHAARRSLQLGECDLALVCGVNYLDASSSLACAVAGMTSPEGVCRTFDRAADGYSRAEGCGVVVLKRLGDAMRDNDAVHCVVKGSAVKQDGKSASLTAPNGGAQQGLLRAALKDARLLPTDVQLLETHGTGTKLGDPVETAAIAAVFSQRPAQSSTSAIPLYLSGVKANVGHLEAGAGIAGLFSILLALEQKTAPPNAHLKVLNEKVVASLGDAPILPITVPTPLVCPLGRRLVAGVSSFGYSGTIAHVLLEEPPEGVKRRAFAPLASFITPTAETTPEVSDINTTSSELDSSVDSREEDDGADDDGHEDQVWQFAGQGELKVGAGKELFDTEESFRAAMTRCDTIVRSYLGHTISEMLYPVGFVQPVKTAPVPNKSAAVQAAEELLRQTMNSQPALVALEYCLASVWLAQGMRPGIVLGHSLGEYAAAVVAGVLSLDEALMLVCERGRLVQQDKRCEGVMYAVRASEEHVQTALVSADVATLAKASLAASNGKLSVVLSGAEGAVKELIRLLPTRASTIKLGVTHAFHSPLLQCVVPPFLKVLRRIKFSPLAQGVHFVSAVRGREVSSAELASLDYWIDHMLLPVQFMRAVEVAFDAGGRTFVEMGPQDTLTKLSNRLLADLDKLAVQNGAEKRNFEAISSIN